MRSIKLTQALTAACLTAAIASPAQAHKTPFIPLGAESVYFDGKCGTIGDPVLDKADFRHRSVSKCKGLLKGGKQEWQGGVVSLWDGDPDAGGQLLHSEPGPWAVWHHKNEGFFRVFLDGNQNAAALSAAVNAAAGATTLYIRLESQLHSKGPLEVVVSQPATPELGDAVSQVGLAIEHQHHIDGDAAEAAARMAADAALQGNINAEAAARMGADVALSQAIATEAALRSGADAVLQGNINAEAATRAAADGALQAQINARVTSVNSAYPITSTGGMNPTIGMSVCPAGQILKSNGGGWACDNDIAGGGGGNPHSTLWQRDKNCGTGGGGVLTANGPETCNYSCGCFSCNCHGCGWWGNQTCCNSCCNQCQDSNSYRGRSIQ